MKIGEKIRRLRAEFDLTQEDLGKQINVSKQTVHKYETGIVINIPSDKTEKMAELFKVSPAYLMGWEDNVELLPSMPTVNIKVYGTVPAGVELEAIEDIIGYEDIPRSWLKGNKEYIGLKVKGDSMYPKYFEGDIVIIKLQPCFENGQDAVVYINGNDATLKQCYKNEDSITLKPFNREYPPKTYKLGDDVTILGIIKEIRRKV